MLDRAYSMRRKCVLPFTVTRRIERGEAFVFELLPEWFALSRGTSARSMTLGGAE